MNATLQNLDQQIVQAVKRMKGLTTMISNLETARTRIEDEIDSIRHSLSSDGLGTDHRDALRLKEESLHKKLDDILIKLADKRVKLEAAEKKLAELKRQVSASEKRQEELQLQIKEATAKVSGITLNKVATEALWTVLRDFQNLKTELPSDQLSIIGDTLLEDLSRQGVNIVTCAALLFMGMVDQATTFAENKGGGGGHSVGGWEREKDEDDQLWIQRCLARSRQMMKPSGHKIRR